VVISDLHIGEGPERSHLDQFLWDTEFERLLGEIIPQGDWPATLVINGDFIDFPQVMPSRLRHCQGDRFGATEEESVDRLDAVIKKGHPQIMPALRTYLEKGGQVLLLPGNHDAEFYFPGVLDLFRRRLGDASYPAFQFVTEGEIHEQGIHIEHGHQYSYDNRFEYWPNPILLADDGERLERPWGTLFLDLVYNDIEAMCPFVHLIHPHERLAWIALRRLLRDPLVPADILIRFVFFFVTKGKRYLWAQMLGNTVPGPCSADAIAHSLQEMAPEADPERLWDVAHKTAALCANSQRSTATGKPDVAPGLMGQRDDRGMKWRARELLSAEDVNLAVFGHTHTAIDGNAEPWWGKADPRRWFNTGSWMPTVFLGELETVLWEDLRGKVPRHEVYYLDVEIGQTAKATLESLRM
jgi:UDP-2,3-diacylglucosamine pyrophosphatase LpxH